MGRKLDAEDVVFSWNRWAAQGSNRQDLVNAVNPAAPVLSLEATDKNTIVIKLKEPVASILAGFSSQLQGQFFILPKEADGGFDVAKDPHGRRRLLPRRIRPVVPPDLQAQPEQLRQEVLPGNDRDADHHGERSGDRAARRGNIYTHYTTLPPDSVLQIKKDAEKIGLYQTPIANVGVSTFFGFKADPADKTPFRDERVRQAWSMSMDRDLYLDTFANVEQVQGRGSAGRHGLELGLAACRLRGLVAGPPEQRLRRERQVLQVRHRRSQEAALRPQASPMASTSISNEAAGTNYGLYLRASDRGYSRHGRGCRLQDQSPAAPGPGTWNADYRDSHGYFEGIAFRLTPVPAEPRDAAVRPVQRERKP